MYLDGYVTNLVHSWHGGCPAGAGGRGPAHDGGGAGRRAGDGGRAGGAAADRPAGGIAASAGTAGGGACRRPPGIAAEGLQPPRRAAGRGRRVAGPVPGPVGTAAGRPAHRGGQRETRTEGHMMTSNGTGIRVLG